MDTNQNGFLSRSEYEEIANRLIQNQSDRSKDEEILAVFRSLFDNFVAGGNPVDPQTQIGYEEFLTNAAKAVSLMQSSREAGRRKNEVFFDFVDTDGSGEISREEYRRYLAVYSGGENTDTADRAFDSIDVDSNGFITRTEFIEGHMHYWFEATSDPSYSPLPYGPLVDS
ncbi:MAG: EF-hand domain-containing protein [Roseofilum sp. SBFL]|nr:EF-hand domain-containing protein [Roseofilum sp. SID3]MBP0024378.1 EF-hand domain-containing protein [Roseofilum sp. SID2]MBP0037806.1 EF-hand domain-containing protein [Roseofilum sp. SID1]MBP0044920.1 EF-hand domain-containing protein [Roseofilum sp. SBFL]